MCGIAGFFIKSVSSYNCEDILKSMASTLGHRGPDDEGAWYDGDAGIGFAHSRLSIIDLSQEGHQPMHSASGRYVITYNGEIYNFNEIRNSLENSNIQWRGGSDTEAILAAIETWGLESAISKFVGMFAFALWDKKERILHLCRDRLGIKPLYYARIRNGLVFGSELKPILKHPDFKPVIDRNSLALYFRHNSIPAPYSIYKNTWKLQPGHMLSVSIDGLTNGTNLSNTSSYWSAKSIAESGQNGLLQVSTEEAVEELDLLLRDAVKLRMVSDVPLGAFLSGGIDSSTVVALMQAQNTQKVKTFSIGFYEQGFNEAEYAKAVAGHLGTDHTDLYITPEEAMDVIPELPDLYDEPYADSSQIPTFLLSRLTRRHVTVSLSGDGGDELFGGYNRYFWGKNIRQSIGFMPAFFKSFLSAGMLNISPVTLDKILLKLIAFLPDKYKFDMPGDRIHKMADVIVSDSSEDMYQRLVSHWKNPTMVVNDSIEPLTAITRKDSWPGLDDPIHKMMYLDLVTYLPDDILTKVDRASMGVSLEARVPMLDHRVVEFAWKLPLSMKIRGNQGKWILRQVLNKYVPKELIERPKTGFGIPIDSWLRGPLRDWAEDLLDEKKIRSDGFLNPDPIRKKWNEHLSEKFNWQYDLWDVLMFQAWKANYKL